MTGLLFACGWMLHQFHAAYEPEPLARWLYASIFTVVLLALVAAHELGHVLSARLHGHRITRVRIGTSFGVTTVGEHTDRSVRLTAAAGPLVGTLAAGAVLLTAPFLGAVWAAALVALVENLANALLFFVPGTDAAKIVAGHTCEHEAPETPSVVTEVATWPGHSQLSS